MLLGLIAGFLGSSLGWQINLLAVQRGIHRGKLAALLVGCGAFTADLIFLWGGLTGTKPLLAHPEAWDLIRAAGVIILLILAARAYSSYGKPKVTTEKVVTKNPTRNYLVGFLVVLGNPAIFFMWLGVVSFIVGHFPGAKAPNFKWYFLVGFFFGALSWFSILALFLLKRIQIWDETHMKILPRVLAGVLVLVAIFLIFDRIGP